MKICGYVLLMVFILCASCTNPTAALNKTHPPITVIDQAGRAVLINQPVERLVSGFYISTSACIALGLTDKLAGIEALAETRPIYAMAAPQLLSLPDVGTARNFNVEACAALEPDLVILPLRLRESAEILEELGIPVILVNPESHEALIEMIALIGEATNTQANAEILKEYYNSELEAVMALNAMLSTKPIVYMGGNGSYLTTTPRDMYQASLIRSAGGFNAADNIEGNNWTEISYEQLITMNPQVIVIPPEAVYTKEDILNDAQLAHIPAVAEERIYQMPKDFEAWDSPVPSCTLGIRWLLHVLHPELYSLEELRLAAQFFYSAFYQTEIEIHLIGV